MTKSSARPFSASEQARSRSAFAQTLDDNQLHLWLCHRSRAESSEQFRREVLAAYTGISPAEQKYCLGEHGKPALDHVAAPAFNVSHSGQWLACAVADAFALVESAQYSVGLDIEVISARRDVMTLARRFYAPAEVARLEAMQAQRRRDYFYDLWTLKESAVKARGQALAPNLSKVVFDVIYPDEVAGETVGSILPVSPRDQAPHYYLLEPETGVRVAICCHIQSALSLQLRVYREPADGDSCEFFPGLRACSRLP